MKRFGRPFTQPYVVLVRVAMGADFPQPHAHSSERGLPLGQGTYLASFAALMILL
jgi:hypothetical protein